MVIFIKMVLREEIIAILKAYCKKYRVTPEYVCQKATNNGYFYEKLLESGNVYLSNCDKVLAFIERPPQRYKHKEKKNGKNRRQHTKTAK